MHLGALCDQLHLTLELKYAATTPAGEAILGGIMKNMVKIRPANATIFPTVQTGNKGLSRHTADHAKRRISKQAPPEHG